MAASAGSDGRARIDCTADEGRKRSPFPGPERTFFSTQRPARSALDSLGAISEPVRDRSPNIGRVGCRSRSDLALRSFSTALCTSEFRLLTVLPTPNSGFASRRDPAILGSVWRLGVAHRRSKREDAQVANARRRTASNPRGGVGKPATASRSPERKPEEGKRVPHRVKPGQDERFPRGTRPRSRHGVPWQPAKAGERRRVNGKEAAACDEQEPLRGGLKPLHRRTRANRSQDRSDEGQKPQDREARARKRESE